MPDGRSDDLPYCGSCLQDFDLYQYPCAFECQHLFCMICLQKLSDGHGNYKCIYDGTLSPVDNVHNNPALFHAISSLKSALETGTLSAQQEETRHDILASTNYQAVACRLAVQFGVCPRGSQCGFDHSQKSLAIARLFCDLENSVNWECPYCQLTISRKIQNCPVCECKQEERRIVSIQSRPSMRENKTGTNVTLDQSLVTEEERPKPKQPVVNEISSPVEAQAKPEEPARSACCSVQ